MGFYLNKFFFRNENKISKLVRTKVCASFDLELIRMEMVFEDSQVVQNSNEKSQDLKYSKKEQLEGSDEYVVNSDRNEITEHNTQVETQMESQVKAEFEVQVDTTIKGGLKRKCPFKRLTKEDDKRK